MTAPVPGPLSSTAPVLARPHLMRQQWRDVGFLHWAVDPALVAPLLPPGVRPDVHDGATWVGLVPFRMVGAGFAHGPGVPWAGTFLETNVRLYSVDATGRRGVVFLSLDTDRAVIVAGARAVFGLPYRWARMRHSAGDGLHRYAARLRWPGTRASSRIVLRPGGPAAAGDLEHFLTARWGLHTRAYGRTRHLPNWHPRWPLHRAELLHLDDELVTAAGLPPPAGPPVSVLYSPGIPVVFGGPAPVR